MKQENFFIVIPFPVLADANLSDVDKLVYGEISALTNKEGFCYASNNYIGDILNKNKRSIQRSIEELKKCGYIQVSLSANDKNETERKIFLSIANPMTKMTTPHDKNDTPPMTKMTTIDNNRDNNIDILAEPKKDKSNKNVDTMGITEDHPNIPLVYGKNVEKQPISADTILSVEDAPKPQSPPKEGTLPNGTKFITIPGRLVDHKNHMVSLKDVIADRKKNAVPQALIMGNMTPRNLETLKTAHQAYAEMVIKQLDFPIGYFARIAKELKKRSLYEIEAAIKKTTEKNIIGSDGRLKYFFAVIANPGGPNTRKRGGMSRVSGNRMESIRQRPGQRLLS